MPIGVLQLHVHLPYAESLKDKRAIVRGLKDRLRGRFNVSVAELDGQDLWQRARIGVAAIGSDRDYLEGLLVRAGREAAAILSGQEFEIGAVEIFGEDEAESDGKERRGG